MNSLDLLYGFGAAVLSPVWARKSRAGWGERFGRIEAPAPPPPGRRRLLLHAVSVGEVNALRELVPLLRRSADVVVSASTDTGLVRARALFGAAGPVVRYPLDFSGAVARFLDAVRPDAVGLTELEVWPNFVAACRRRGIPVGVVNGRLSERSFRGYRCIRGVMRSSFTALQFAAVQNADYAARFRHMGVPDDRVMITDSMKWDTALVADDAPGSAALGAALGVDRSRPLVVAGSTAEGEEALLHAACGPGVQLLCAPRSVERFAAAAAALPGCVRRSRPGVGDAGSGRYLLDTIGELRAAYALADVAVVGRSFGRLYGSDPIEPVGLGKATVIGPAHRNFDAIVAALRESGGLAVATAAELPGVVAGLLADPSRRAAMASAGRRCIESRRGATARHAELLLKLLGVAPVGA
ncbi:MAG: 3-deoxy-D-manno-octulosonic acid transferase [Phycisphaerae bacterium]|nr:3-deoxy-D-manno-octulosonic acid transferase [Phycisphaerae bacterium]